MTDDLFTTQQRRALRAFTSLLVETAEQSTALQSDYDARMKSVQQQYERRRAELDDQYDSETAEARSDYEARTHEIHSSRDAEYKEVEQSYKRQREQIESKANATIEEARRLMNEAIWLADSVYEAQIDQPDEQFEQDRKGLEGKIESLQDSAKRALRLCQRFRVSPPTVIASSTEHDPESWRHANQDAAAGHDNEPDSDLDPDVLLDRYCGVAEKQIERIKHSRAMRFLSSPWLALLLIAVIGAFVAAGFWRNDWALEPNVYLFGGAGVAACVVVFAGVYLTARSGVRRLMQPLTEAVQRGLQLHDLSLQRAADRRDQEKARIAATHEREIAEAKEKNEPILQRTDERREHHLTRLDTEFPERLAKIQQLKEDELSEAHAAFEANTADARQRYERELNELETWYANEKNAIQSQYDQKRAELEQRWDETIASAKATVADIERESDRLFKDWSDPSWQDWSPPFEFAPVVPFGWFDVKADDLPGGIQQDKRFDIEDLDAFTLPAPIAIPDQCSLLIKAGSDARLRAIETLQTTMLRLLTCLPPGKVRFTIFDPIGLGENFAAFMHLADYDDSFVGGKIWAESRHIEQRLADLTEHMENVIQKYLRNEFNTIAEYNERAGEIAEPYRFLVICDFPTKISDVAAQRLQSILTSGARCGVYTLMTADPKQQLPQGVTMEDIENACRTVEYVNGAFTWRDPDYESLPLRLESMPGQEFVTRRLHQVGEASIDATRVEVPFETIAPDNGALWSMKTDEDVVVPLGRAGATRLQRMRLGHGTAQHALIAGKTGSGKSTLLHVLVTNLALWYSPDEIEFYLVDFKKGVEFKTYAKHNLPHARAVAIESDREFGLSVLQRIDQELKRRGNVFRALGVQDLAGYRRAGAEEPIPRTLLTIDEFQEFFTEDDKIAQDAALLLDRLVRQGRAFGIHVLLGSQTLGGAYSLARATIGQMGVRIALQCNESDSYLIMSDDNSAARLLSRPGEAIYNDAGGLVEGNSPFQISWLPDNVRETYLQRIENAVNEQPQYQRPPAIVFEGGVPADVSRNQQLSTFLREAPRERPASTHAYLGEPVAIKPPTSATFTRRSGAHLLTAGQRDEAALAMMATSLVSLAAQHAPDDAVFYVLDGTPPDAPNTGYLQHVAKRVPHVVHNIAYRDVDQAMADLGAILKQREDANETDARSVYVFIYGLQRFRTLRKAEDSFSFTMDDEDKPPSADKHLANIIREGPVYGMHVLTWCDSLSNLERTLERQALREFEQRVLFQMSGTDSSTLIDSPEAGKLGLQRALLFIEEEGRTEKFRPYALPEEPWLDAVAARLGGDVSGDDGPQGEHVLGETWSPTET